MRPKSTVWTRAMLLLGLATSSTCGWMARVGKAVVLERLWNRMRLRLWLNPCSRGGQAHTSRAADQKHSGAQRRVPSVVSTHLQPLLSHIHLGSPPAQWPTGRRGEPSQGQGIWWEAQRWGVVRLGAGLGHLWHSTAAAWTKRGMRGPSTPWRCPPTAHGDTNGIREHCNKAERTHLIPRAWPRWVGCSQKLREFHCGQKPLSDGLTATRKFFYMISKGHFLQKYLSDSMTAISSHRTAVFIVTSPLSTQV